MSTFNHFFDGDESNVDVEFFERSPETKKIKTPAYVYVNELDIKEAENNGSIFAEQDSKVRGCIKFRSPEVPSYSIPPMSPCLVDIYQYTDKDVCENESSEDETGRENPSRNSMKSLCSSSVTSGSHNQRCYTSEEDSYNFVSSSTCSSPASLVSSASYTHFVPYIFDNPEIAIESISKIFEPDDSVSSP